MFPDLGKIFVAFLIIGIVLGGLAVLAMPWLWHHLVRPLLVWMVA